MEYKNMVPGIFLSRPNRFIAHIEIGGNVEVVHVKNTGRCRELLPEGARVWCQKNDVPSRKTKYDLISVQKGERVINMDSQAPNIAVGEWLHSDGMGKLENIRAEVKHGASRFDFAFEKDGKQCYMEVKGVTLETEGICAFPDAPTLRGTKHLQELKTLAQAGCGAYILFVIQMENVKYLHPNDATDPAFSEALRQAAKAGVKVLAMDCQVSPNRMILKNPVSVVL